MKNNVSGCSKNTQDKVLKYINRPLTEKDRFDFSECPDRIGKIRKEKILFYNRGCDSCDLADICFQEFVFRESELLSALRGLYEKTRKLRSQLVKSSASYQAVRECERFIGEQFQLKEDKPKHGGGCCG